jgi:hypothetical protein
MNLSESMKHVLKNKTQNLFSDFWKEDLKLIITDLKDDFTHFNKSGLSRLKSLKNFKLKDAAREVRESTVDTLEIFKIMPRRMKDAFTLFREEVLTEMEGLPDGKERAIFGLKLLGALGTSALGFFYGMKRASTGASFRGLRLRSAFAQYVISEFVFKVTQLFILRFLKEVEAELSEEGDVKRIRFFKDLLSHQDKWEDGDLPDDTRLEPGDRALEIVESLKNYIIMGSAQK